MLGRALCHLATLVLLHNCDLRLCSQLPPPTPTTTTSHLLYNYSASMAPDTNPALWPNGLSARCSSERLMPSADTRTDGSTSEIMRIRPEADCCWFHWTHWRAAGTLQSCENNDLRSATHVKRPPLKTMSFRAFSDVGPDTALYILSRCPFLCTRR